MVFSSVEFLSTAREDCMFPCTTCNPSQLFFHGWGHSLPQLSGHMAHSNGRLNEDPQN